MTGGEELTLERVNGFDPPPAAQDTWHRAQGIGLIEIQGRDASSIYLLLSLGRLSWLK